ncbi:hypothetical protein K7X08_030687 [Anisodus acutangulus]|uniref:BING4 C-terminal domain-containing protein n=1 Tax=Anisodus acutangulus TaxID=402998 RepID=A0A9Q1M0L8_9SOLA|nr:hypothetical protein K7X08_030687 [Anisodus acutangulus]
MAYAALSSLMHTLQQLLQSKSPLICGNSVQQHVESVYQSLCALQVFLEYTTKEAKDIEILKVIEKRIRDVVYKAEDRVDSRLRGVILADNGDNRERACRCFNEELQEVEKEVNSLKKEVMQIDFNKHGSKSAEAEAITTSSSRRHGSGIISTIRSLVVTNTYLFHTYERPCSIISHFVLLKVLDVSSINYDFSYAVPKLVHLRYVAAWIDKVPSLAKLWNLQTIIFGNKQGRTDLELLPEIWTKTEIRHLDIGWKIHLPDPLEAEGHGEQPLFLNNLQTLYLRYSPFLAEILRRTPNLIKLKIELLDCVDWPAILDFVILLQELVTLIIEAAYGPSENLLVLVILTANLFETSKQRREKEVRSHLDKLPSETIMLDLTKIGSVRPTRKKEKPTKEEIGAEMEAATEAAKSIPMKKKTKGRSKPSKIAKKKQEAVEKAKKPFLEQHMKKRKLSFQNL